MKSFKSPEEFPADANPNRIAGLMMQELETAQRIMKVQRLMKHRNIVSVLEVPRSAMLMVKSTGQQAHAFHGIVTEYCDGGELYNYITKAKSSGGVTGLQFNEQQSRYLFKQIVDLLMTLHHPPEGPEQAYYHGDLKVETAPPPLRARKWPSQGPPAAVGERYLTAGLGWPLGRTWPTAKAFAFLCVDSTQRSETGQVRGLRWHNRPTEWEGKEWCEADGHCSLRRERPREGKGEGRGKARAGRKRKVKGW